MDAHSDSKFTHTSKGVTTVTTLGGRHELLDVVDHKLAAWGLHHTPPVGGSVVGLALAEGDTLSHLMVSKNLTAAPASRAKLAQQRSESRASMKHLRRLHNDLQGVAISLHLLIAPRPVPSFAFLKYTHFESVVERSQYG